MYDREVDVPRLIGHYWLDPPSGHTPPGFSQQQRVSDATVPKPREQVGERITLAFRVKPDRVSPDTRSNAITEPQSHV